MKLKKRYFKRNFIITKKLENTFNDVVVENIFFKS